MPCESGSLCPRLQRVQQSLVVTKCSSEATQRLSPSTNSDLAQGFSSSSFSSFLAEAGKILNVYLASFREQKALMTFEYSVKQEHTQVGLLASPVRQSQRGNANLKSQCWGSPQSQPFGVGFCILLSPGGRTRNPTACLSDPFIPSQGWLARPQQTMEPWQEQPAQGSGRDLSNQPFLLLGPERESLQETRGQRVLSLTCLWSLSAWPQHNSGNDAFLSHLMVSGGYRPGARDGRLWAPSPLSKWGEHDGLRDCSTCLEEEGRLSSILSKSPLLSV